MTEQSYYVPPYYTPTSGGGWTCANCGQWVPMNQPHTCPAKTTSTGGDWQYISVETQEAQLLKQILALLEKIYEELKCPSI
jgi:hypothetical protein